MWGTCAHICVQENMPVETRGWCQASSSTLLHFIFGDRFFTEPGAYSFSQSGKWGSWGINLLWCHMGSVMCTILPLPGPKKWHSRAHIYFWPNALSHQKNQLNADMCICMLPSSSLDRLLIICSYISYTSPFLSPAYKQMLVDRAHLLGQNPDSRGSSPALTEPLAPLRLSPPGFYWTSSLETELSKLSRQLTPYHCLLNSESDSQCLYFVKTFFFSFYSLFQISLNAMSKALGIQHSLGPRNKFRNV